MKIQRLTFLGVRGLSDITFDHRIRERQTPRCGLHHGPRGVGQDPRARGAAGGEVGHRTLRPDGPRGGAWIAPGGSASKVAITFYLDEEERTYAGTSEPTMEGEATFLPQRARPEADEGLIPRCWQRYDHTSGYGKIEYFPSNRRVPVFPPFHGTNTLEQRILRAGKDPRKYSFVLRFLRDLENSKEATLAFSTLLASLSSTLRYEPDGPADGMPRCFRSRGGAAMMPTEISDAEADAVIFRGHGGGDAAHAIDPLIDRPELFADPRELRSFLGGLRSLGKDNQLIMATSSPELIAASEGGLVLKVDQADGSRR